MNPVKVWDIQVRCPKSEKKIYVICAIVSHEYTCQPSPCGMPYHWNLLWIYITATTPPKSGLILSKRYLSSRFRNSLGYTIFCTTNAMFDLHSLCVVEEWNKLTRTNKWKCSKAPWPIALAAAMAFLVLSRYLQQSRLKWDFLQDLWSLPIFTESGKGGGGIVTQSIADRLWGYITALL